MQLTTTNFTINYDETIGNLAARAAAIESVCEAEFAALTGWFGITGGFGPGDRINVFLDQPDGSGAWNFGYQAGGVSHIHIDRQAGTANAANAAEIVRMLFVAELVEVFMSYNEQHHIDAWDAGDSNGEGLSQLCSILRFRKGHYLYYGSWVDAWLQSADRHDWVTEDPEPTDKKATSFGCALLFLYYLKSQLGFSVEQIIQHGARTLEGTYHNLTGGSGAFDAFHTNLVAKYFPPGNTPKFVDHDDPFPLRGLGQRHISIDWDTEPVGAPQLVATGVAHVKPFLTCPVKDYDFTLTSTAQRTTLKATAKGYGQPVYRWRVNGIDVPRVGGTIAPLCTVTVLDATNPEDHSTTLEAVTIGCAVSSDAWSSTLVLDVSASVLGRVDLTVEALATEKLVAPGDVDSGAVWAVAQTESASWSPEYYRDGAKCRDAFRRRMSTLVRAHRIFDLVRTLPDPPPDYDRVLGAVARMGAGVGELRAEDANAARELERAVTQLLNVSPNALADLAAGNGHG